jgi:hypothetical protein
MLGKPTRAACHAHHIERSAVRKNCAGPWIARGVTQGRTASAALRKTSGSRVIRAGRSRAAKASCAISAWVKVSGPPTSSQPHSASVASTTACRQIRAVDRVDALGPGAEQPDRPAAPWTETRPCPRNSPTARSRSTRSRTLQASTKSALAETSGT